MFKFRKKTPVDLDEEAFARHWNSVGDFQTTTVLYIIGIVFNACSSVLWPIYKNLWFHEYVIHCHWAILGIYLVLIPFSKKQSLMTAVVIATYLCLYCVYAYLAREVMLYHLGERVPLGLIIMVCVTCGTVVTFGSRDLPRILVSVVLAFIAVHISLLSPAPIFTAVISVVALVIVNIVVMLVAAEHQRTARREFAFRSRMAPIHIVRNAGIDTKDIDKIFAPRPMKCVCISSDWRGYQKMSARMETADLVKVLNGYYDLCDEILKECLPAGNYYSDWIADELFVVVYEVDGADDMVDSVIAMCARLLRDKRGFCESFGLPLAIDVGLSYGEAVVGMMGPQGFRKATALGETPGRARRIQTLGKILRREHGEVDRIILDSECLMEINLPYKIEAWDINPGEKIRDVEDSKVYYIENLSAPSGAVSLRRKIA